MESSSFLKNLSVSFEEVEAEDLATFDQVAINKMNVNEFTIVEVPTEENPVSQGKERSESAQEQQMLAFDLPINPEAKPVSSENVKKESKSEIGRAHV